MANSGAYEMRYRKNARTLILNKGDVHTEDAKKVIKYLIV